MPKNILHDHFRNENTYQTNTRVKSIMETIDLLGTANIPKAEMLKKIKEKIKYEVYAHANYMELFTNNLLNGGEIPSFVDRKHADNSQ